MAAWTRGREGVLSQRQQPGGRPQAGEQQPGLPLGNGWVPLRPLSSVWLSGCLSHRNSCEEPPGAGRCRELALHAADWGAQWTEGTELRCWRGGGAFPHWPPNLNTKPVLPACYPSPNLPCHTHTPWVPEMPERNVVLGRPWQGQTPCKTGREAVSGGLSPGEHSRSRLKSWSARRGRVWCYCVAGVRAS